MVGSLGQRVRKIQTKVRMRRLLAIRLGPGALKLPKDVSRIHLRFAPQMYQGHMGPRKFWRHELVRLKYHNPAVSMTIDRNIRQSDEALMTVFFAAEDAPKTSGTSTGAPNATTSTSGDKIATSQPPSERVETVTMAFKREEEILDDLIRITKATTIHPTAEEKEELRRLAEDGARSKRDSDACHAVNAERRKQAKILADARGAN
ncbi:Mannan endo-1,6-alpha-mannosidase DCW1 [Sphaceloma murrayae]|uniref:Mannan endo-1,6-alpha-mannosidase DCW1 n=1 Tax=Sphaceloma murrayae TaxID=2082308 RepID=A0A2K1QQ03_9PEZI|nr:Mannan endo-1,6-alpha-mannosidase DCW1 [Sphaceloma murrayae]